VSALDLLNSLAAQGVRLAARGGALHYQAPAGVVTDELKARLAAEKPALLASLGDPGSAARQVWHQALSQVADAWEQHAAAARAAGREPAWIDDDELQGAVRDAILRADLAGTLAAVAAWRRAWDDAMAGGSNLPPALLAAATRLPAADLRERPGCEAVPRKEATRWELPARAGLLIDEVEGRRSSPKETVHALFACTWVSEERSITAWLGCNAAEVAALWPEAPLAASWFDWRLQVGPEAMPALDQAWSAILGMPAPWKAESLGEEKDKKP
jgi:hypothetical protein